ncbi:MAG: glycosyltransferase [Arenicellales bacterium]
MPKKSISEKTSEVTFEPLGAALPADMVIGKGQFYLLRGTVRWTGKKIERVSAQLGEAIFPAELFPSSAGQSDEREIFIKVLCLPEHIGVQNIHLNVINSAQSTEQIELGKLTLLESERPHVEPMMAMGDTPLIAICMATYQPEIPSFTRQLETILNQSYTNWLLIICDDASPKADWSEIEALCALDPRRIRLYRYEENQGFYHNFERALDYVPDNAELIAFADQDDVWYPDKLQKLVDKLNSEQADLVYSDMRIVHESGEVLSESYWQGRKNEYRDFDTVFLANTVTGAASLFKRDLLEVLLPFPERVGDAFHDHWLACAALSKGKLAYVDAPLYDYMQYGTSVIGHCDFVRWSKADRMKSVAKLALRFLKPTSAKTWLGQKLGGGMAIYKGECLRLQIMANTLKVRLPDKSGLPTLNLMNGGWASAFKLLKTHLKILKSGRTTDDAEFRLAMGFIARQYQKKRLP